MTLASCYWGLEQEDRSISLSSQHCSGKGAEASTLTDRVKMMTDLKADWFLVMMVFDAQCIRQAIYEVIFPVLCQHLQMAVCRSTGNIMQVVSGIVQVVSAEHLHFCSL